MAQTVKNLPAMQETQVHSLVRKIHWRKAWQPTPVVLPGEFHEQRSPGGYSSWGLKDPLEEGMATHSSSLAWEIPWTEDSGGLESMGSHKVGHK